jgi:hypothetical protein
MRVRTTVRHGTKRNVLVGYSETCIDNCVADQSHSPSFLFLIKTGKAQIVGTILIAEIATEAKKPHYMMGGSLPEIVFPQVDFSNVDPATVKVKRSRELNNGRLAMIAISSFISEYFVPGSVPVLSGIDAF